MDPRITDTLAPGFTVLASDGEKLGTVSAIHAAVIHVEKGFLFVKDYNIPLTAIAQVDPDAGEVHLNLTKEQASHADWEVRDDETSDEPVIDNPIDGEGYTVLTGAASMPSPLIIEEIPTKDDHKN
jgi:hypothetical protein